MVNIAILHGTLPQLLAQSPSSHAAGIGVARSAADLNDFRSGLACQRVDALVLGLERLGSQPVREIDRLRKYTRARATIVTHNLVDGQLLREIEDRLDLVIAREPITPTRLRGLLARVLDMPELATQAEQPPRRGQREGSNPLFDDLIAKPVAERRYDDVQICRVFEEAINRDYQFTYHVAEILTHLNGFEDYCHRRNAGKEQGRGLNHDVERAVAHSRALLEEALARLNAATGLAGAEQSARSEEPQACPANVLPMREGHGSGAGS